METVETTLAELKRMCEDVSPQRILVAARFYRDRLGWAVHPLQGPNTGEEKARGKAPILKGWPNHTVDRATDELLSDYFGNGHDNNLGVVVRRPHICVDLDSKADNGESVRAWLAKHPEIAKVPRERTGGGAHLHFVCHDLPPVTKSGKPHKRALVSQLTEAVTAELYFNGLNIVVSPSRHKSGVDYTWEVVGEISEATWEQLKQWFGFQLPDEAKHKTPEPVKNSSKRPPQWWQHYNGDLTSLDLAGLFQSYTRIGETINADKKMVAVHCPWHHEHSEGHQPWKQNDSSTVIFRDSGQGKFPGFKCHHAHCAERGLKEALEWFEKQAPGIVDQHCSRQWVYEGGQTSEDGRPRIVLPGDDRPESEFATEVGKNLAPLNAWFLKSNYVVAVRMEKFSEKVRNLCFCRMEPAEVRTAIETYIETGFLRTVESDRKRFVPKSIDMTMAKTLISSGQFKDSLPEVVRILDVQIPIRYRSETILPKKGYDERFHTYCDPNAPEISKMTLEEAKELLFEIHKGFCWRGPQDLVHALARLITPLTRGLMGWDARFPLWYFKANRPRAGKDYLAGVTMLVYEGFACEDAPLSTKNSEETRKRITSALMSGRRMIHFSNCSGFLASQDLEQAVTSRVWGDRVLGGNTEVKLPNELEFSLSANLGLSYSEDLEPRLRIIELSYPQEDANSRTFPNPFLHEYVLQNRDKILSAIAALAHNWIEKGCPPGPTPFTSFPEWGRTVGGIMVAAGLGDPCLPHEYESDLGGDQRTRAMKALFEICYAAKPDAPMKKAEIYDLIQQHQEECEALAFFGDVSEASNDRSAKTKLGKNLAGYEKRELGQIRMERVASGNQGRSDRAEFRFFKINEPGKDQGDKIADYLFHGAERSVPPTRNGDIGDVGDVCSSVSIKSTINEEGGGEKKEENIYREAGEAGEGRQGRQGLQLPDEPPTLLTMLNDLEVVASAIRRIGGPVALDIETYPGKDALNPYKGEIRLLTLAAGEQESWVLDLKAIGYNLGPLKPVLEEVEIVGHSLKFDALWLWVKCGLRLQRVFCTCTASRILTNGSDQTNDLGECLRRHLKLDLPKDQGTSDWGAPVLTSEQLRYSANDVAYLHKLKAALQQEIEKHDLARTLNPELALLPVIVEMEASGIAVDREKLSTILEETEKQKQAAESAIRQFVGDPDFNPASTKQLLEKFKARGVNLKDTAADTLAVCKDPLAAETLRYREATAKCKQAKTLVEAVGPDGRIHSSFNPLGAETGRFSSSKPNLQNVNRGVLRECFIAPPGSLLIVADYSQIELRAAAAIAEEKEMLNAYAKGEDLHARTASLILQKPLNEVNRQDRQLAKAVNFGLIYGQGAKGLVKYAKSSYGVNLSEQEAELFRQRFFNAYPGLRRWHQTAWTKAKNRAAEVRTRSGRRRLLPRDSGKDWERFTGLVNTAVQGSCADGLKLAMVDLAGRLPAGASIISTIHDELIVEASESCAEEVKKLVESCMVEKMGELFPDVLILVEIKTCKNWGEK